MRTTAKGEWVKSTGVAFGSNPTMRSADTLLTGKH
jgi:hypothetical protein